MLFLRQMFSIGDSVSLRRCKQSEYFSPEDFGITFEERMRPFKDMFTKDPNALGYLLCDRASVSWLVNLRSADNESLSISEFALITRDDVGGLSVHLVEPNLGEVLPHSDADSVGYWLTDSKDACLIYGERMKICEDPLLRIRCIKNDAEIASFRRVHKYDAAIIREFIAFVRAKAGDITHAQAANALADIRRTCDAYICESFPMIIASQEHSCEIHYDLSQHPDEVISSWLMLDVGAQYHGGTTDMTRTLCLTDHPSDEQRKAYSAVLKGHIALSMAQFPEHTPSAHLDAIARHHVWAIGHDYPHSTGHGVAMMGPVHEIPPIISPRDPRPLAAGMIVSNEPGFYHGFGVRLEGLMLVQEAAGTANDMLSFEMLTHIPFDEKLIMDDMLTYHEKVWLDEYHHKCV